MDTDFSKTMIPNIQVHLSLRLEGKGYQMVQNPRQVTRPQPHQEPLASTQAPAPDASKTKDRRRTQERLP